MARNYLIALTVAHSALSRPAISHAVLAGIEIGQGLCVVQEVEIRQSKYYAEFSLIIGDQDSL